MPNDATVKANHHWRLGENVHIRGAFHKYVTKRRRFFNFQNMKNREFYSEYQLWVLLRWRHYCDVTLYLEVRTRSVCAVFCPCTSLLSHKSPSVNLNNIANYEKNEQVQRENLFKRQTLLFHFLYIVQILLNIDQHADQTAWENRLLPSLHQSP